MMDRMTLAAGEELSAGRDAGAASKRSRFCVTGAGELADGWY